jgi:hypothetical protein
MTNGLRRIAALAFFLAAASCGGGGVSGNLQVSEPLAPIVRANRALLVRAAAAKPDWQPHADELANRLARELEGLKFFTTVVRETSVPTEVELIVTVTDLLRVTAGERSHQGDAAGQARIVVRIDLKDRANGSSLGSATVDASAFDGPKGGVTEDVEDHVYKRIVSWVSGSPQPEE